MSTPTRLAFLSAMVALVVGAGLYNAAALMIPRAWGAMVHLMLFGWITGMITGVTFHTMPVFTRRAFVSERLLVVQLGLNLMGWLSVVGGQLFSIKAITTVGLILETIAALLLVTNIFLLLGYGTRLPGGMPIPPFPNQKEMDRLGTRLTSVGALTLPLSLLMLTAVQEGWLASSWWLAAEHLATLGWITLMIIGVAYHVAPRFTGRPIRQGQWATVQSLCHLSSLVLMVLALGFGWNALFLIGAVLMTLALGLFAWGVMPTLVMESPPIGIIGIHTISGGTSR